MRAVLPKQTFKGMNESNYCVPLNQNRLLRVLYVVCCSTCVVVIVDASYCRQSVLLNGIHVKKMKTKDKIRKVRYARMKDEEGR